MPGDIGIDKPGDINRWYYLDIQIGACDLFYIKEDEW